MLSREATHHHSEAWHVPPRVLPPNSHSFWPSTDTASAALQEGLGRLESSGPALPLTAPRVCAAAAPPSCSKRNGLRKKGRSTELGTSPIIWAHHARHNTTLAAAEPFPVSQCRPPQHLCPLVCVQPQAPQVAQQLPALRGHAPEAVEAVGGAAIPHRSTSARAGRRAAGSQGMGHLGPCHL